MGVRAVETRRSPAVIELHIDELVLHGFNSSDRYPIGDAVESELARLMTRQSVPRVLRRPLSIERLDGGTFQVAPGAKAQTIGAQLAKSLHHQLLSANAERALRKPAKGASTSR